MKPAALSLEYRYHPPASKDSKGAFFLLHGYGSNEDDLFSFVPEMPQDFHYFSLQAPYSLDPFGYAWYAINFEASQGKWSDTAQAIESREKIKSFIEEAIQAYDLDPENLNLLGFSQGCILSFALALSYPEKFNRVVGLSGYVNEEMLREDYAAKEHEGLRIYSSHGQLDPVIPIAWAQQTPLYMEKLKIDLTFEEYPIGHGVSPQNFQSFKRWIEGSN